MMLVDNMAQTGQRIGGTSEMQVGEGRSDAPVGTTLAMIEQATKLLNAVHKRLHAAQAEEFQLLVEVFKDHPESFWQRKGRSNVKWDEPTFLAAINNCELVPQADPNTASHAVRVMKITALKQLQQANPSMYDPIAIDTAALQAIGYSNPAQFFAPPQAQQQPPPEMQQMMAKMANEKAVADAKVAEAQAKVAETQAKISQGAFAPKQSAGGESKDPRIGVALAQAKIEDSKTRRMQVEDTQSRAGAENENRDLDRISKEKLAQMDLTKEVIMHHLGAKQATDEIKMVKKDTKE